MAGFDEAEDQEFELIPMSPIRKLEKRLDQLENTGARGGSPEFYKELVEIIRMNQVIVDEMAKANDALRIEISRLPSKLDSLISKMDEMLDMIKSSAGDEMGGDMSLGPVVQKLDELIETNKKASEAMQSAIEDMQKSMKRPSLPPPPPMFRKPPLFPPKPI